ncbi:NAD(P)-binding protein [Aspergillus aculeatinus CBS 121060]|uniref:NAD(P)-binding protein n=1 Tax=Aspergillus aculeatinus CBS 121060 TaxID=1448322 RepID=A0ACD1GU39_9EURO|nr:NAD(P)-binding protein [Aspergillus aculeatinus CBS 121060]RAH64715.1 NAD(P)-binding protein [Aspergillus aculeatinus CBS 121060]
MASRDSEFVIFPNIGAGLRTFLYSQLFVTPPYPRASFANQTIIVTGSNTGLGLEAARHFYRLGCARLILAVRNTAKGEAAKEDILCSNITHRSDAGAIEVWSLDLSRTASTIAFAERVKRELDRVDVLVENAGVNTAEWTLCEGHEQAVQINVLNTFLLALMLLPKLRATRRLAAADAVYPHLVIVSSEAHRLTAFPEIEAPDLYDELKVRERFSQQARYQATKLIEVLFTRELVARLSTKQEDDADGTPPVIINIVNPGLCASDLARAEPPSVIARIARQILERTTEVGARTLVLAASAPKSSHGELQSDGKNQNVEGWIYTEVGRRVQKKVFEQTLKVLEERRPGISLEAGL